MPTYEVIIPGTFSLLVQVEADDPKEAENIAMGTDVRFETHGKCELLEMDLHREITRGNIFYGVQNTIEVIEVEGDD